MNSEVFPGADVTVVDSEVDMPLIGHGAVRRRGTGDVQVQTAAPERVELRQDVAEGTSHRGLTTDPCGKGEIVRT